MTTVYREVDEDRIVDFVKNALADEKTSILIEKQSDGLWKITID